MYRLGNNILKINNKLFYSQGTNPVWSGLTSYWRLDEASGTIYDSKGTVHSTSVNSITYGETGKHNTAIYANAEGDYVSFGNVYNFERTDSFSFSLWHKWITGKFGMVIAKMPNASPFNGYAVWHDASASPNYYFTLGGSNGTYNTAYFVPAIGTGVWFHLVVTYNGNSLISGVKAYVNGISKTVGNSNQSLNATIQTSMPLQFFSRNGGYSSQTYLDEVGIWNRVLTPTEVSTLYNSGNGLFY